MKQADTTCYTVNTGITTNGTATNAVTTSLTFSVFAAATPTSSTLLQQQARGLNGTLYFHKLIGAGTTSSLNTYTFTNLTLAVLSGISAVGTGLNQIDETDIILL